jgi:hypothetical protein
MRAFEKAGLGPLSICRANDPVTRQLMKLVSASSYNRHKVSFGQERANLATLRGNFWANEIKDINKSMMADWLEPLS